MVYDDAYSSTMSMRYKLISNVADYSFQTTVRCRSSNNRIDSLFKHNLRLQQHPSLE